MPKIMSEALFTVEMRDPMSLLHLVRLSCTLTAGSKRVQEVQRRGLRSTGGRTVLEASSALQDAAPELLKHFLQPPASGARHLQLASIWEEAAVPELLWFTLEEVRWPEICVGQSSTPVTQAGCEVRYAVMGWGGWQERMHVDVGI